MQADLFFVMGVLLGILSFPVMVNAFSGTRFPRAGLFLLVIGSASIAYAFHLQPAGYDFEDVPAVFMRVFDRIF